MKKLRLFMIVSVFMFCLMALMGCRENAILPAPTGVRVDQATLTLRWNAISNASGYILDIDGESKENSKNKEVKRNAEDLTALAPGEYTIRIKALGRKGYDDSAWSEEIEFTREAESGLIYKLINANTEYKVAGYGEASGEVPSQ